MLDPEVQAATVRFEQLIANEEKIEPRDWMPDKYRHNLVRQISQDRKSTRLNSSHIQKSRMPSSA